MIFVLVTSSLIFASTALSAPAQILTQKDVADLVLNQGTRGQEVNLKYQLEVIKPYKTLANFDWNLGIETGQERDRLKSFSLQQNPDYERLKTTLSAQKSLITGTSLTFDITRVSQKQVQSTPTPPPLNLDSFNLTIEQSLWRNFLGVADRSLIDSEDRDARATRFLRVNELQDLVLESLRQFWNTYVAQESFREAMAAKERSEKLVAAVKRKSSFGYSAPAELPQIQAELETRQQNLKIASADYLKQLDALHALIKTPKEQELKLSIPQDIPPIPSLARKMTADKRAVRSQQYKVDAARDALQSSKWKNHPHLGLVAKYSSSGLGDRTQDSMSELMGESANRYYFGIKLQQSFGSGLSEQEEINKAATLNLEQIKLARITQEQEDKEDDVIRRVTNSYFVVQSMKAQVGFREKAMLELSKTFNQGRTDISVYLESMNKFYAAQIQWIRAIGDYYIALNEWAAVRDELIPSQGENL